MIRSFTLLLASLAVLSLGACGELPRPFAHDGPVMKNELIELPSGDGVRVVVADGLDPNISDPLRNGTIKALGDAGIPASAEPTLTSGYVLTGAVQIDDPQDGTPEGVRFVWQLTGRDGLAVGMFDKEVTGRRPGWLARDPALLESVAKDASQQVAALLLARSGMGPHVEPGTVDGKTEAAVPAQLPQTEAKIFVEGVTGAPGDGDEALARAMTSVLKRTGVPLAADAASATHRLAAVVKAEPQASGVSNLSIAWQLSGKDGTPIGTISQKNPVRTTLIEKRWGELAHIIAGAASDGILDAFEAALAPPEPAGKLVNPLVPPKTAAK